MIVHLAATVDAGWLLLGRSADGTTAVAERARGGSQPAHLRTFAGSSGSADGQNNLVDQAGVLVSAT